MNYIFKYKSNIGNITLASDGENLIGLWFDNQKYYASTVSEEYEEKNLPIFEDTKEWLDIYFDGKMPNFTPKLLLKGTEFQEMVWEILKKIPYGRIVTYGDIARQIAVKMNKKNMSSQAVGNAVGKNPISIIIPCHRVLGSKNKLTGYAAGLDKKKKLLDLEGIKYE